MRAVFIREPGDESVLEIREAPDPVPGPHHVRARVKATAVNRADLLQRMGVYPAPPGAPADIPGLEYAGVVDAIGPDTTALRVGDRVFGVVGGGSYAELLVVHEREAAKIPEGLDDVHAAAVPEAFITAYDALAVRGGLRPGERVLVHAVGSGVGTAGLQVAKALGCFVVGTSRTADKLARAETLGMDVGVLVPRAESLGELLGPAAKTGFDVALDLVGGAYTAETVQHMASKGRVVVVGLTAGTRADIDLRLLLHKRLSIIGTVLRARPLEEKIQAADLLRRTLSPWLGRKMIHPVVDKVLPLDDVREAHRLVGKNDTFGKVVLTV
jgi:putative PIG3 family NAD(P)H quinone oxidoreductase